MERESMQDPSRAREERESERQDAYAMHVARSIEIARPRAELYRFWRDFENLPKFMDHLESVRVLDERRSHWETKGSLGKRYAWDAEIVTDRPEEVISWRSVDGDVKNAGSVRFEPAARGTEVKVEIAYDPPAGRAGVGVAKLLGDEPGQMVEQELERLKRYFEGEDGGLRAGGSRDADARTESSLTQGEESLDPYGEKRDETDLRREGPAGPLPPTGAVPL